MKIIKQNIDFNEAVKTHSFAIINTNPDAWKTALDLLHKNLDYYNFQANSYSLIIGSSECYYKREGGNYYNVERLNDWLENGKDIICINDVDFLKKYTYEKSIDDEDMPG